MSRRIYSEKVIGADLYSFVTVIINHTESENSDEPEKAF